MQNNVLKTALNVKAEDQNKYGKHTRVENENGNGKRILFLGNSITLHGCLPEIGWYGDYGMAASSKDKDYVHIVEKEIGKKYPDSVFCICNVAKWECNYREYETVLNEYEYAAGFDADIIICKVGGNAASDESFDAKIFFDSFSSLIRRFDKNKKAKIFIALEFYHHPANAVMKEYAEQNNIPYCLLEDLSEIDEMKALGRFEHVGVQSHPGDTGMKEIASRILEMINNKL